MTMFMKWISPNPNRHLKVYCFNVDPKLRQQWNPNKACGVLSASHSGRVSGVSCNSSALGALCENHGEI